MTSEKEIRLDIENAQLRRLLAQAGVDAAEHNVMEGVQRLLNRAGFAGGSNS